MPVRPYADSDLEAVATLHAVSRRHAYADLLPASAVQRITPAAMLAEWADRLTGATEDQRLVVDEQDGALVGQAFYRRNGWAFDGIRDSHAIGGVPADIERWSRSV